MRAAQIIDGVVVNTMNVQSLDFLPGLVDATGAGNVGDTWADGVFTPAPTSLYEAPAIEVPTNG